MSEKLDFIKEVLLNQLTEVERVMLIISIMEADEYGVDKMFNIINDVLYLKDWPALAKKLDVVPLTEESIYSRGDFSPESINELQTRLPNGGHLSNLVWNVRNEYLSAPPNAQFNAKFIPTTVQMLVEGFMTEIAVLKESKKTYVAHGRDCHCGRGNCGMPVELESNEEVATLRNQLEQYKQNYCKLATHHNLRCTCLEIYS